MDLEARIHSTHPQALRLWLRMLTCSQLIEKQVRAGLRDEFNTTLPRFDLMAQLEREPQGMKMNELSRRMMVSGGNITVIADQLEKEQLVQRKVASTDRRSFRVLLTASGRKSFARMAVAHEQWVVDLFSGLDEHAQEQLNDLLGHLKTDIHRQHTTPSRKETT